MFIAHGVCGGRSWQLARPPNAVQYSQVRLPTAVLLVAKLIKVLTMLIESMLRCVSAPLVGS